MITINTNLSSLIAQKSLLNSTTSLNEAIERMTTGFKINHAKDNAANYSISIDITTKINSYEIAEENASMGLDMVTTMSENLDLITNHVQRIRDLCEQASNGTYSEQSLKAIESEIESRLSEISRLKSTSEFNGIKLFETPSAIAVAQAESVVTGSFIEEVDQLTEEEAIAQGYTIIKTADELQNMKNNLSGKYILMNDIDLEGYSWAPIGDYSNGFTGELNGNGFVIENLEINNPSSESQGLFGYINGGTVKNLGIEDAVVIGQNNVGILAGYIGGATTISNVYVTGKATASATNSSVGGLVGASTRSNISNCYADVNVVGVEIVGGLIGRNDYEGPTITNCYSKGTVSGEGYVGGLLGGNSGHDINISNSYTTCTVTGNSYYGSVVGSASGSSSSFNNVYYLEQGISGGDIGSATGSLTSKTASELQAMIDNGTLPKIYTPPAPPTGGAGTITLQVGIKGDSNSQISFELATALSSLEVSVSDSDSARASLTTIDNYLNQISDYQTKFGSVQNRLMSVIEEVTIQRENLVSSRSTIRDTDVAEESSRYIQSQILQQASATLLSTANQTPSIALQLI